MVYPFECKKCGAKFELMLNVKDYENKNYRCPNCGSNDLKRIYKFSLSIKTNDGVKS